MLPSLKKRLFFLGIIIAVTTVSFSFQQKNLLEIILQSAHFVTYPFHFVIYSTQSSIQFLWEQYIDVKDAKQKLKEVLRKNLDLETQNILFKGVVSENNRLRTLLNLPWKKKDNFIVSQVISMHPNFLYFRITGGSLQGILPGMAVIHDQGAVGIIGRTFPQMSDVLLTSNPNVSLDVLFERTRQRGIAEGTGMGNLAFKYTDISDYQVFPQDTLLTSGLTGPFPSYVPVGEIRSIEFIDEEYHVEIEPSVTYTEVKEVVVLLNKDESVQMIQELTNDSIPNP